MGRAYQRLTKRTVEIKRRSNSNGKKRVARRKRR